MVRALNKIYSVYALVLFAVLLLIALFAYAAAKVFVPYPKQIKAVYKINRAVMVIWSPLTGMRFKRCYPERANQDQTYIVVMNHYSIMDMFAAAYGLHIAGKPLIKKELLQVPILGWLFRMAAIPVIRESKSSRHHSLARMKEELKKRISLLIFPEGTRNVTDNPLGSFHNGAFKLAIETGTPLLPVVITNIRKNSSPHHLWFRPAVISLHFLHPIDPKPFGEDVDALKLACYGAMESVILTEDPAFQTN